MAGIMDAILGLQQRLGQHADAAQASMQYANQNPSLGSVAGSFKDTVLGTLLGLPMEAFGALAKAGAGEIAYPLAAAQTSGAEHNLPGFDPNSTATAAARQIVAGGSPLNPGGAIDAARTSPDTGVSDLAGLLELATNPLNYAGPIGQFGRGLEAGAPLAGRTIAGLGDALSGFNEVSGAPIGLITKGGRARLAGILDQLTAPGQQAAPALTQDLPKLAQQYAGVGDTLAAAHARDNAIAQTGLDPNTVAGSKALPNGYKNPAAPELPPAPTPLDLPLVVDKRADYNQAAKASGIPTLRYLKPEPSSLAPRDFDIRRAARELNAQQATTAPALNEALQTALPDLPTAAETGAVQTGRQWSTFGPESIYPGEGLTPGLLEAADRLRALTPSTLDINAEVGAMRDPVTLMQDAYGADWQRRLSALTGGSWGKQDGAQLVNGRIMLGGQDLTTAVRDYMEARGGPNADAAKAALKGLLPAATDTATPAATSAIADTAGQLPADTPAALSTTPAHTGTLDDMRNLILGEAERVGTMYPPMTADFYARRANIDPAHVPGMLQQLVDEGTLGADHTGALALKPGAPTDLGTKLGQPWSSPADTLANKQPWEMTPAEYAAHFPTAAARQVARSHGQIVQQALDAGETVPPDILAQYPGMVARAGRDVPAASEIVSNAQYRDRARQQLTDARGQDVAAAYDQTLANAPSTYSDEPTLAGYLANEEARLQALQARAVREPNNAALQNEIDTSRFYVERLRRDATAPATDLPALSGAQDAPQTAADLIARGQQAKADLFSEAADQPSTGGTPSALDQIVSSIKNPGLLGFPGGLPSPAVTRALIGGGVGGIGGGATGLANGLVAGDNPDQLKRDAALGAIGGVGVGAATGANLPQLQAATQGALSAIATHAPALLDDTIASPEIQAIALKRGLANQAAAKGVKGAKLADLFTALDNLWRGQTTQTGKNLIQDAGTIRLLVSQFGDEFGTDQAAVKATLGELARNLDNPDLVAQAGDLGQTLKAIGQDKLLIPQSASDTTRGLHNLVGVDMVSNTTNKGTQLNAPQRIAAGMGIGLANAALRVSPLSLVTGGARAYFAPFADSYFGTLNGLQHDAPRVAFLQGALQRDLPQLATDFLGDLAAQGIGVKPLEALGGKFDGATLGAEIRRAGGGSQLANTAAREWDTLTETLIRSRADRVAHLFGDFRDAAQTGLGGTAVKGIGRVFPFATWALKYAPVLAEIAAKHPRVTTGILGAELADAAQAKQDGRPAWQVGTIPLSTETPLVGAAVRARLGGQSGTMRLNPLSMISPYGGQQVSSLGDTSLDSAETPYEHIMNYANVVGLSPHPLLQAAAYVSGQDYKGPSSLSRTAGLEQLPQALPSVFGHNAVTDTLATTMPSAQNTLDAARKLISGQSSTATDPVARRYGELVLATTGKTLVDPANRAYLDPSNPAAAQLREQATREAILSGAASNAYSLTSPMSATAQSTEAEAAAKVRGVVTQLQNSAVHQTPLEAAATQEAILRYQDQHPGALVYQGATKAGLAELRLADWERQNTVLRSIPTLYNYQKQIVMEQLGLVPPGTYASMVRNYELQQRMPGQFRPSYLPGVPMQPQQPLPWGQGGANTGAAQLGH